MSIDYSEPKYKIGDKMMHKETYIVGRVIKISTGIKRLDDVYTVTGNDGTISGRSNDFSFVK